jgi:2'-5' RNA ligase
MATTTEPSVHRLFIAISAPDVVKVEIEKIQNELRHLLPAGSVRWTRPEHFHLTLRFLGNVLTDRTGELTERLRFACCNIAALKVRAECIGFFPERGFPRVIWTAVSDKDGQLAVLQCATQSATQQFTSEPAKKEFASHITLGRVKRINRQEANILANFATKMHTRIFGEWEVRHVELFRSELLPEGPRHTIVAAIPLSAKN